MVAIASGNSPSNTSFHKEGKLYNNTEKCEKEISSSSLEKQSVFHLKSKEDKLCTALGESKKPAGAKYIRYGSLPRNQDWTTTQDGNTI